MIFSFVIIHGFKMSRQCCKRTKTEVPFAFMLNPDYTIQSFAKLTDAKRNFKPDTKIINIATLALDDGTYVKLKTQKNHLTDFDLVLNSVATDIIADPKYKGGIEYESYRAWMSGACECGRVCDGKSCALEDQLEIISKCIYGGVLIVRVDEDNQFLPILEAHIDDLLNSKFVQNGISRSKKQIIYLGVND